MTTPDNDSLRGFYVKSYIEFSGWDDSGEPVFRLTAHGRRRLGIEKRKPGIALSRMFHGWLKCEWALLNAPWYWAEG